MLNFRCRGGFTCCLHENSGEEHGPQVSGNLQGRRIGIRVLHRGSLISDAFLRGESIEGDHQSVSSLVVADRVLNFEFSPRAPPSV